MIDNVPMNIKNARNNAGLSYDELSVKSGIPKSTLQRYETGTTAKIPLNALEKIAEALNVTSSHLMGWEHQEDIIIAKELQFTKSAIAVLHKLSLTINKENGVTLMDILSAMVSHPLFINALSMVNCTASYTDDDWNDFRKQLSHKRVDGFIISTEDAKKMNMRVITDIFENIIFDISNSEVETFNQVDKSDEGITIKIRKENEYLYEAE